MTDDPNTDVLVRQARMEAAKLRPVDQPRPKLVLRHGRAGTPLTAQKVER